DLVQDTSLVEEYAPTSRDTGQRQSVMKTTAEVTPLFDHGAGFRAQMRQQAVQTGVESLLLLRINRRPAVLAADAVATPAIDALVLRFGQIEDGQTATHATPSWRVRVRSGEER